MQPRAGMQTILPLVYLLPIIILIEGFASIAVEILTIRQLLPVAGSNVVVTSLIIGIFLLFLALGYEKGGRASTHLHQVLRRNFFIVALLCGFGLSYTFIATFFSAIQKISGPQVFYPLIAYLFAVLAPTIYLLGQTLPITMNIVKQDQSAGAIAGKALGLSTIGSFLGALLTTLVLMHFFGLAWTVFIVFSLLILLTLLLCQNMMSFLMAFTLSTFASAIVFWLNVGLEKNLFLLTDNYANYEVLNSHNANLPAGARILKINDVYSSYIDNDNTSFIYIKEIRQRILNDLKLHDAEILVLGAGGFTLSAGDSNNNHFTYVDIDDRIRQVVEPNFIEKIKDTLIADDARNYLKTTNKKYSIIVLDAYSDVRALPAHLLTHEFMKSIKSHLTDDGYAMFNIIANPTYTDAYSRRIDNTIRSVFGSCTATPSHFINNRANIIYICGTHGRVDDKTVYVDNLNRSATDSLGWY